MGKVVRAGLATTGRSHVITLLDFFMMVMMTLRMIMMIITMMITIISMMITISWEWLAGSQW